ncbi:MAG: DUF1320 domain-containing protein [Proteobacteria bacterium]|nr:DUF1320 domain-containing protein [Pseudomonadota bacterium]MBU1387096.1 DUF1320 domain-containing protein [Pseudomonadota bacterium]MBU1541587.1 DUF1320 domain-containing protein [Pseudomonadota bacterium]MBU2429533.1 DUF1320 domain-containing protein [Pseudomonadota bacterium]MBU2482544.1 DUF1320 domain-containing protein [Pseudomonadota bacterium]
MAYCTLNDIQDMMDEDEIIRFTDDTGAGTINTDVTDKAISGADALIDSYLASRYSVPVTPVPDILLNFAVDIAIYKICSRRSQAPEEVRTKYEDAIKWLEKVASGKVKISSAASAPASQSNDGPVITTSPRIFSRDSLRGF